MNVGQEACNVQTFTIILVCKKYSSTFLQFVKVAYDSWYILFLYSAV